MADQINFDVDYFDHIKTIRLIDLLGRGAELLPIRLWCHVAKYHSDSGRITGYSPQEIETVVLKWWGKPGEAIEALQKTKHLDKTSDGFDVHGWKERNGHLEAYHRRAKVAAKARWDGVKRETDATAKAMLKQCSNLTNLTNLTYLTNYLPHGMLPHAKIICEWLNYKKEKGQTYKPKGFEMLLKRLEKIKPENIEAAIEHSMANNWAGIYEPKGGKDAKQNSRPFDNESRRNNPTAIVL